MLMPSKNISRLVNVKQANEFKTRLKKVGVKPSEFALMCKRSMRLIAYCMKAERSISPEIWVKLGEAEAMTREKLCQEIVRLKRKTKPKA